MSIIHPFRSGDVVVLKSGGAAMTVRGVKDGVAAVSWHTDHAEGQDADYPFESLALYVEKPKRKRAALRSKTVLKDSTADRKELPESTTWPDKAFN